MRKIGLFLLLLTITLKSSAIDGLLIKTIDYSFKEKWDNTLGGTVPQITTCDTVFKKQYFFLTAIAADYKLDKKDIADVEYSIKIKKPNNSIYFSQENLPLAKREISNKNNLQMSDAILKVCFENEDDFGKYTIQIEIKDKVSGKTKKIESMIVLAELPSSEQYFVKDDNDFMKWFEKYYENPKPESALSYYVYYSQSSLSDKESSFWPVFSIFLEITKNNGFLYPQMIDCYKKQDLKTKVYLLYLLTYSGMGTDDFFNNLEGDEKDTYLKIKDSPLSDFYGEITDPSQLDMLWGTFMASGSYKPIFKLIQTLEYTRYQGELDKYKKSKQTEEDKQKALYNAIYDSLVWSLKSNIKIHGLVANYCNWAFKYGNLTDVQKDELKKILTN